MRIIAGKYKGRELKVPKGMDVRPTTDRVKEAMFSSILSCCGNLQNTSILDAFAGSGSLGFEAISRGASNLASFESNKKVFNNILNNLSIFEEEKENIKLVNADVIKYNFNNLNMPNKFDILFFDPPYNNKPNDVLNILIRLKDNALLNDDALIVYEHSSKNIFDNVKEIFYNNGFVLFSDKIYGDIAIEYLKLH